MWITEGTPVEREWWSCQRTLEALDHLYRTRPLSQAAVVQFAAGDQIATSCKSIQIRSEGIPDKGRDDCLISPEFWETYAMAASREHVDWVAGNFSIRRRHYTAVGWDRIAVLKVRFCAADVRAAFDLDAAAEPPPGANPRNASEDAGAAILAQFTKLQQQIADLGIEPSEAPRAYNPRPVGSLEEIAPELAAYRASPKHTPLGHQPSHNSAVSEPPPLKKVPPAELLAWTKEYGARNPGSSFGVFLANAKLHFSGHRVAERPMKHAIAKLKMTLSIGNPSILRK
jgi:hypothetical protein